MQRIHAMLTRVNTTICSLCSAVVALCLAAISAILLAAVSSRYFFNDPITWAQDATCFLLIWMVLAGSVVGMRQRAHVAIDLLVDLFPLVIRSILKLAGTLAVLYVSWFMVRNGIPFMQMGMQRIIPSMEWLKFGYAYLALPVGFSLMALICLELLFEDVSALFCSPDKD